MVNMYSQMNYLKLHNKNIEFDSWHYIEHIFYGQTSSLGGAFYQLSVNERVSFISTHIYIYTNKYII